jgi:hypothetical protein
MSRFYICSIDNDTPCVFSESSWRRLPESASTNMSRCIRHGALISFTVEARDKSEVKAILKQRDAQEAQ